MILALVGMVQPIQVVASSLVADPSLSTLPEMTGMANLWYTSTPHEFLDSNWYVVDVRLLDVSGTIELDREVRDFKYGLQAMETTQLTASPLLLWEGVPTVLDMIFVNQGDTVDDPICFQLPKRQRRIY